MDLERAAYYPASACKDCDRGVVGRFGEMPPTRCPACDATYERRITYRRREMEAMLAERDVAIEAEISANEPPPPQVRVYVSRSPARQIWLQWPEPDREPPRSTED